MPKKLCNSKHDSLIKQVDAITSVSSNIISLMRSAYYKVNTRKGLVEGDIDLLQFFYDSGKYFVEDYNVVPFKECSLLVYEVKSCDSSRNYFKALSQLKKSKGMLLELSNYGNVDCFYVFGVGNSLGWRFEEV